jgi:hypothetical protein
MLMSLSIKKKKKTLAVKLNKDSFRASTIKPFAVVINRALVGLSLSVTSTLV